MPFKYPERYVPPSMQTPEQRAAARRKQEGLGDTEFVMDVVNRMGPEGYEVDIDPSVARVHPGIKGADYMLDKGIYYRPFDKYGNPTTRDTDVEITGKKDGKKISQKITLDPDTVTAFEYTPEVWAHEYRHRQRPEMSETTNRLHDLFTARSQQEAKSVLDKWVGPNPSKNTMLKIKDLLDIANIPRREYQRNSRITPNQSLSDYTSNREAQSYIMREL